MSIGLGLRQPHYKHVLENDTLVNWFEVHSENFFLQESVARAILLKVREKYPISLHGIGLSLGSAEGVNFEHLHRLKELIDCVEPFLVSEHLSWNMVNGRHFPDLFPLPYAKESLALVLRNIDVTQNYLKRSIFVENPSSYLEYRASTMSEVDFLIEVCKLSGAKILLDINNVFVSCYNHNWDAKLYLDQIPVDLVAEIHLAGHSTKKLDDDSLIRIDTHDGPVCQAVWDLYGIAIKRFTKCPTLIEWDANIPEYKILEDEAIKALDYHHAKKNTATI